MRWGMGFVIAAALFLAPASALASPPPNDYFANRQVLTGSLPIEATGSNVEATKEEGESLPGLAPAGHSIWFEWEATSTGWVTIGACDDEFPTILGVFTGTEIDHLSQAVPFSSAVEGPECPFGQRQFTLRATAGSRYVIAVDGNGFFVEPPPPVTEGEVVLRIEETPLPPNDAFADASPLQGEIFEEPGARFYDVEARGYNWRATTEPGESFEEPGSGASVWYSWTAPETGEYRFGSICCGAGMRRVVYSGNALGELTPVLSGTEPETLSFTAGTKLHIGVFGLPDGETGEPSQSFFLFSISARLPPLPPPPPTSEGPTASPPDTTAPQTSIVQSKLRAGPRSGKFWFASSEGGGSFLCNLDRQAFKPCTSPKAYHRLRPGRHAFRVKAVDAAGNVDASPAIAHFAIPKSNGRRR